MDDIGTNSLLHKSGNLNLCWVFWYLEVEVRLQSKLQRVLIIILVCFWCSHNTRKQVKYKTIILSLFK